LCARAQCRIDLESGGIQHCHVEYSFQLDQRHCAVRQLGDRGVWGRHGVAAIVPVFNVTGRLNFTNGASAAKAALVATKPTAATSASASSPAGRYPITVSGALDPNYTFSYVPGFLTITGGVASVSSHAVPGYLAALASVSTVGSSTGISGAEGAAVGLGDDSSQGPTADGPFSEERAFDNRTHANDYLPRLSLEILNGGLKMPAGVP
jgi:hypothetical protein